MTQTFTIQETPGSIPVELPITHYGDDTFVWIFEVYDVDESGVETGKDLSGALIEMKVKNMATGENVVEVSTHTGEITLPEDHTPRIEFTDEQTADLVVGCKMRYDLKVTIGGVGKTYFVGTFTRLKDEA
jgi:hypothetical protein